MTANKESFKEVDPSDCFKVGLLRLIVFPGLNSEWLEARFLGNSASERPQACTTDLTVGDARRLRDWLNHVLPEESELIESNENETELAQLSRRMDYLTKLVKSMAHSLEYKR